MAARLRAISRVIRSMFAKRWAFDVALSFASEDRPYVDEVATHLREMGVVVFYDAFEEPVMWGRDVAVHLRRVFGRDARSVVLFISKYYASKAWPTLERDAALSRDLRRSCSRVLSVRLDDSQSPNFLQSRHWLNAAIWPPDQIALRIRDRVRPGHEVSTARGFVPCPLPQSGSPDRDNVQRAAADVIEIDLRNWIWVNNVELGGEPAWGPVLHNAPPYNERPNAVEYAIAVSRSGAYALEAEYAAQVARPVRILVNGVLANPAGLPRATGGWGEEHQESHRQALMRLSPGLYLIRLERGSYFPHVRRLWLERQGR